MRWVIRILIVLLLISIPGYFFYRSFINSFEEKLGIEQNLFYVVEEGSTLTSIGNDLAEKGVIEKGTLLTWLARLQGDSTIFAAAYEFDPTMTVRDLYEAVTEGKALSDEIQVTIIEGLTVDQIADQLEASELVDAQAFVTAASNGLQRFKTQYSFLSSLPSSGTLEGYLYPDTYRFFQDATVDEIILKMLDTFELRLTEEARSSIERSGRTIHEVITLASIIQDEVRTEEQMGVVGGIFQNRLDIGMALQSDATINYITRSGRDRSTFADLEIDSPYNTYKNQGLPPGPIGSPGLSAIMAAVEPDETDYLFFLTDKAGRVYYAETLAGHNENRQYLDRE